MDVARVERSFGIRTHDDQVLLSLLEIPAGSGHGAPGADPSYEMRDPSLGLFPYLRAGGPVVGLRVHRVVVLVRLKRPRDVAREAIRNLVIGLGRLRRHGARTQDDLGAIRAQTNALPLPMREMRTRGVWPTSPRMFGAMVTRGCYAATTGLDPTLWAPPGGTGPRL